MHYLYNLIVIKGEHRAGLKGRGARGNFFLEGSYDVIHDVIVCKSYAFAYSQGSPLFFPVVENVLTRQMHIQLAARREFMIWILGCIFTKKKCFTG